LVILDLPFQIIPKLLHTGNQPPYEIGRLIPKSNYQFQCTVSACSHLGSCTLIVSVHNSDNAFGDVSTQTDTSSAKRRIKTNTGENLDLGVACNDCKKKRIWCKHSKKYFNSKGTTYSLVEDEVGVQRFMPIMKG